MFFVLCFYFSGITSCLEYPLMVIDLNRFIITLDLLMEIHVLSIMICTYNLHDNMLL